MTLILHGFAASEILKNVENVLAPLNRVTFLALDDSVLKMEKCKKMKYGH